MDAFWSALGGTVVNHGDFFVVNPIEENFLKIGSGDLLDLVHLGGECGRVATDNSLKNRFEQKIIKNYSYLGGHLVGQVQWVAELVRKFDKKRVLGGGDLVFTRENFGNDILESKNT